MPVLWSSSVPPVRPQTVEEVLGFPHPVVIPRLDIGEGNLYTTGGPSLTHLIRRQHPSQAVDSSQAKQNQAQANSQADVLKCSCMPMVHWVTVTMTMMMMMTMTMTMILPAQALARTWASTGLPLISR